MKSISSEKHISASETAQMLGISVTSVKNWVRHGYIESVRKESDQLFLKEDVISLKKRIQSGEIKRLNSRANKSNSSRIFLPDELFINDGEKLAVTEISAFIMRHNIPVEAALFLLSLNILSKKGMLENFTPERIIENREPVIGNRKHLTEIICNWKDSVFSMIRDEYFPLLKFALPEHINIIGIIYQSILMEGDRNRIGMYYTPDSIVTEIVKRVAAPGYLYLDPCCGTGQFLLAFSEMTEDPEKIYGIDIDPVAVNVAKINLLIRYHHRDFSPRIFCADSLLDLNENIFIDRENRLSEFDCIATNPPWGSHFTRDELKKLKIYYPEISSGESFSYFLVKSLRLLRDGGVISFVLPESVLNVKMHADIRNYILKNFSLSRIESKERIFRNVFSPAAVVDIRNTRTISGIKILKNGHSFSIRSSRFTENRNFVFDINIDTRDEKILEKIYSREHLLLKDNSGWALGIVTGNNAKFLTERQLPGSSPIIKGNDITPFKINPPSSYINYRPEKFQQTADLSFYTKPEKLVYRYISNRLVFAIDREKRFTLNSANILLPELPGTGQMEIMGLFNSELYQYIFQKRFSSLKVLKSHIEELPVPVLTRKESETIRKLVCRIESGSPVEPLNDYIYTIFRLDKSEIDLIKKRIL